MVDKDAELHVLIDKAQNLSSNFQAQILFPFKHFLLAVKRDAKIVIGIIVAFGVLIGVTIFLHHAPASHGHREKKEDGALYLPKKPDAECIVCLEPKTKKCAVWPCGHGEICRACTRKLTDCPLCKAPIVRVSPIVWTD